MSERQVSARRDKRDNIGVPHGAGAGATRRSGVWLTAQQGGVAMKALVYTGPETMHYGDAPEPDPALGDCLIRVEAVGI